MIGRSQHKEFGEFITNMRESIGWSVDKLAEHFNTTRNTIQKWEKGRFSQQFDPSIIEEQLRELVRTKLHKKRMLRVVK